MREFNQSYIHGRFVPVQGTTVLQSVNPSTEQTIAHTRLANRDDAKLAIAAAKGAQPQLAGSSKSERIEMLKQLEAAVLARADHIRDVTIEEYGGPVSRAQWVSQYASQCFARTAKILAGYEFTRHIGESVVHMRPVGVAALIAPWNSVAGTICNKLASAIAAGCASVIKPSELSPWQTEVTAQALHAAGLPAGFFNILLGRGDDVGDELSTSADIAKISFTGSTSTGKIIARAAVDSMKRVSLGLTGKSAAIVLDDAPFAEAIGQALGAAFMNNGQACVAGTRLLVPRHRLEQVITLVQAHVSALRVGDPRDPATAIGPLASRSQYERIQHYIRRGLEQGATLIAGGEGRPQGLQAGYFVKPTVFAHVDRDMDIAREEIFGPVLSILAYDNEADAIAMANDSIYGLQAYVFSSNVQRAERLAQQLQAGAVLINRTMVDPLAPFGGVKQSGLGRENGLFGLEAFLEPKAIVTV
ncbi:aldehyde dehydrogenase family protein [Variovorax sp. HJSM1_2]|uniref:aldehyde dehydrogenase family protein n=1 Tax=Variovorax sp. HJSM1_2 TaxID=3366263 RepID=UPI003BCE297E